MNRRSFLAGALALAAVPAAAEPAFKRLTPLLVDLPGFSGAKPNGGTLQSGEGDVIRASRKYSKDAASLVVSVMVGWMTAGALMSIEAGPHVETAEEHTTSGDIDGFRTVKSYKTAEKSGALLVALGKRSLLTVNYRGLAEDEAVALARKLDWKALAEAAQ